MRLVLFDDEDDPITIEQADVDQMPELDSKEIAERVALIIDVFVEGETLSSKKEKLRLITGIPRNRINHVLSASRQTISIPDANRLCNAFGVTMDWIYRGRRDGLPLVLQQAIDSHRAAAKPVKKRPGRNIKE